MHPYTLITSVSKHIVRMSMKIMQLVPTIYVQFYVHVYVYASFMCPATQVPPTINPV